MRQRGGSNDTFEDDAALDTGNGYILDVASFSGTGTASSALEDDELPVSTRTQSARSGALGTSRLVASSRARSIIVTGLALLICLAILLRLSGGIQGLTAAFEGASASVAGVNGNDTFYFLDGARWGRLTVDGKAISLSSEPTPITLGAGRHTLQYQAAPFPTLRCQITVPADVKHDSCPLITNLQLDGETDEARIIDLGCIPTKLPTEAYDQLTVAVSRAIVTTAISTTVDSGEHYLGASGVAAVATTPLHAAVSLALNLDPSRGFADGAPGSSCITFCSDLADTIFWTFQAHMLARWSFTTPDGRHIPTSGAAVDTSVRLAVEWVNGAWSVDLPSVSGELGNFCSDALNGPPGGPAPFTIAGAYSDALAEAPSQADGCVEVVSRSDDISSFTVGLPADAALFIYRFGVILAGNALAHQEQPRLAVATDQERILALKWYDSPS